MDKINDKRRQIFDYVLLSHLAVLEEKGYLARPYVPDYAVHNGHMFYVRVKDLKTRTASHPLYEGKRSPVCLSLYSAAQRTCRKAVRDVPWGGCVYDKGERVPDAPADVLQPVDG